MRLPLARGRTAIRCLRLRLAVPGALAAVAPAAAAPPPTAPAALRTIVRGPIASLGTKRLLGIAARRFAASGRLAAARHRRAALSTARRLRAGARLIDSRRIGARSTSLRRRCALGATRASFMAVAAWAAVAARIARAVAAHIPVAVTAAIPIAAAAVSIMPHFALRRRGAGAPALRSARGRWRGGGACRITISRSAPRRLPAGSQRPPAPQPALRGPASERWARSRPAICSAPAALRPAASCRDCRCSNHRAPAGRRSDS